MDDSYSYLYNAKIDSKLFVDNSGNSRGVVGLNLVLSDKVFFSVDSGSLGHA